LGINTLRKGDQKRRKEVGAGHPNSSNCVGVFTHAELAVRKARKMNGWRIEVHPEVQLPRLERPVGGRKREGNAFT